MKHFDELPLVIFTTLAILGGGTLAVPLVGLGDIATGGGTIDAIQVWREASASRTLVGLALLFAGLVVSLAHLGKPARAPRALIRVGGSRLSLEIALAGATLAVGVATLAWPSVHAVALLCALCAAAFLLALGFVYALPGQLTWGSPSAITPLTTGLGFGMVGLLATPAAGAAVIPLVGPIVLVTDVIAFVLRWRAVSRVEAARLSRAESRGRAGRGSDQDLRPAAVQTLLATRLVFVDVVPFFLLLAGLPTGAAGALGLGILVDRLGFYLLAVQRTTEREIARVEDVIADSSGPGAGDPARHP